MNYSRVVSAAIVGVVAACSFISLIGAADDSNRTQAKTSASGVEEIYIARSFRESREPPTEFCTQLRTGFDSLTSEDRYTFRSISVRPSNGQMMDNDVQTIGRLRACFGSTADPKLDDFYAEGSLGAVSFKGRGECLVDRAEYPEPGITSVRCFLHLSSLPPPYVGGELTTNSIRSRNVLGRVSDPPGYTQPSIATIRLWKKRSEKY